MRLAQVCRMSSPSSATEIEHFSGSSVQLANDHPTGSPSGLAFKHDKIHYHVCFHAFQALREKLNTTLPKVMCCLRVLDPLNPLQHVRSPLGISTFQPESKTGVAGFGPKKAKVMLLPSSASHFQVFPSAASHGEPRCGSRQTRPRRQRSYRQPSSHPAATIISNIVMYSCGETHSFPVAVARFTLCAITSPRLGNTVMYCPPVPCAEYAP